VNASSPPGRPRDGRAVLVYTAARVGVFLVCLAIGWVVGLNGLFLFLVALVVSGALSLFVLQRQRLAMSAAVERSVTRAGTRLRQHTEAEDAYVDEMHR
jgi:hypothetical protein